MRIYTLQVHTTNPPEKMDELYHFSEYDNLCREFEKQVGRLENSETGALEKREPKKDDCGEVTGGFKMVKTDGSFVIGIVYDYDILNDE